MSSSDIPQPGRLSPYGKLPVPQLTPELLRLVGTGTVYSLSVNYYEGMPKPAPMVPYTISARNRHGDLKGIEPATFAAESITMAAHTGTHIDALCHIGERQDTQGRPSNEGEPRLYASPGETVPAAESASHQGLLQMNIAQMPPIIARAVLLDVAGLKGMDVLPDAYMITVEDLEATIAKQGTRLQPGTAVLLRTGFYHHLASGNPAYVDQIAGPGLAAARFLVDQGMILIGADNMSVEAMPPMDHAVHRYLLVHNGITHLENLYLEELAEKQICKLTSCVNAGALSLALLSDSARLHPRCAAGLLQPCYIRRYSSELQAVTYAWC